MWSDYLLRDRADLDQDLAVQLCCLQIRYYFKDMTHIALDKKSNIEYLERDIGLHKFLPRTTLANVRPKTLRKSIQHQFKKVSSKSERECVFKALEMLREQFRFDQERFHVSLGVSIPVFTASNSS